MERIIENFEIGLCVEAKTGTGPKMLVKAIHSRNLGFSYESIQLTYFNEFSETWVDIWMDPAMVKILPEGTAEK